VLVRKERHDVRRRLLTQFMYSILSPASRHSSSVALTLAWISLSALDWFWRSRRRRILQACHIASEPMWVLGSIAMPGVEILLQPRHRVLELGVGERARDIHDAG
jgi:hypothetical protein